MQSNPASPVAVVGAGIAGLAAARALAAAGRPVTVFDKARGVGGRTSLRRGEAATFDHGAQYFTARDPRFRAEVDAWLEAGHVARWEGRLGAIDAPGEPTPKADDGTERFVGVPGMNQMARAMSEGLDVRARARVERLERTGDAWSVWLDDGSAIGGFDAVVVTAPTEQAAALVDGHAPELARAARGVPMQPCLAAMVAFETPLDVPFDGLFVNAGPLSWAARNSSKPGRPEVDAWVLHASPDFSEERFDAAPEDTARALTEALREALGLDALPAVTESQAHRWRYSLAAPARTDGALADPSGLFLAGDWLAGSKVQGAWHSGRAAAEAVLAAART
ncbi:MAG: FAD-dependent oxidoreductase [Planctomycetota bacterium]